MTLSYLQMLIFGFLFGLGFAPASILVHLIVDAIKGALNRG